ncbi:hypothetical protein G3M48_002189 [Beauveria asiatica]|uniref:Uncharacterized protein n=1 Tax=Beauveria asiatica TaxID=1069075 RepID=A0AAW0RF11_9HYPO
MAKLRQPESSGAVAIARQFLDANIDTPGIRHFTVVMRTANAMTDSHADDGRALHFTGYGSAMELGNASGVVHGLDADMVFASDATVAPLVLPLVLVSQDELTGLRQSGKAAHK